MSLKGVVSLTYDGGGICHVETVLPHLEANGLRGTFYVDPVGLLENLPEWGSAVSKGHEIGNGSLFAAVTTDGLLDGWTPGMVIDDVRAAKELIEDLFPEQTRHSLALPWQRPGTSVNGLFGSAVAIYSMTKNGLDRTANPFGGFEDFSSYLCDGHSVNQIMNLVEQGLAEDRWAVLSFQGVGVGDPAIDACVHLEVCQRLASMSEVTVLPVIVAAAIVPLKRAGVPRFV